ncbi:TIGR00282 family metallophosphoesterase [Heliorestis acidaminivorans]|uniref:TIGR00282 family metallophosphoesterase n=1 Tax=Heliorestis acidaminivorans TaxID=553427 RepID=A0A6I0F3T0_9FIRM|nr:TIGR00282 family metallophosphoesterase [Heliorestis acidaminivorans]KAB2954173.1 TIGR00282 family metallophosphoesterase [Heliorestis acidaminivorans]
MRLLFIGDIIGKPGRRAIELLLPKIIKERNIDFVIANGENSAGGNGITKDVAYDLFNLGVNVITMGNHTWDKKEIFDFIDGEPKLIRPANYPVGTPGRGWGIFTLPNGKKIAVLNYCGRVFMDNLDCPFQSVGRVLEQLKGNCDYVFVDFHGEATSEKVAFGWHLAGRASVVVGTHTHVQTADERILPGGTAYITDVGMTGPRDSVIGVKKELVLKKFITSLPVRFETAAGTLQFCAVITELAEKGKAADIERINLTIEP